MVRVDFTTYNFSDMQYELNGDVRAVFGTSTGFEQTVYCNAYNRADKSLHHWTKTTSNSGFGAGFGPLILVCSGGVALNEYWPLSCP